MRRIRAPREPKQCETGVSRWIEIPPEGAGHSREVKASAPGVNLLSED
ncbi:hypothetical protein ABIG06_006709 [Bradyrhizobium sp. USDA 326]